MELNNGRRTHLLFCFKALNQLVSFGDNINNTRGEQPDITGNCQVAQDLVDQGIIDQICNYLNNRKKALTDGFDISIQTEALGVLGNIMKNDPQGHWKELFGTSGGVTVLLNTLEIDHTLFDMNIGCFDLISACVHLAWLAVPGSSVSLIRN